MSHIKASDLWELYVCEYNQEADQFHIQTLGDALQTNIKTVGREKVGNQWTIVGIFRTSAAASNYALDCRRVMAGEINPADEAALYGKPEDYELIPRANSRA